MGTLVAEFAYCTTEDGCVVTTKACGLMAKMLLLTDAVIEEIENRYESPLSNEMSYVNKAEPATAATDWLLLATLPLTSEPAVSARRDDTEGDAWSRLSPPELRRDTVMLAAIVVLPDAYW